MNRSRQTEQRGIATIVHDFNNLLTVIKGNAGVLADAIEEGDPSRWAVDAIVEASSQGSDLIGRLLVRSRDTRPAAEPPLLNEAVHSILRCLSPILPDDIRLEWALGPDTGAVLIDGTDLQRAVLNLLMNALEAMPAGGEIRVQTARELVDETAAAHPGLSSGCYGVLTVADTGRGMSAELRRRILEPSFTTKGSRVGTGLGLAVVADIAKDADGYIGVDSIEGQGSIFKLYLASAPSDRAEPDTDPLRR